MTVRLLCLALVLALGCGQSPRAERRRDASTQTRPAMPPGHGLEIERIPAQPLKTRVVGLVRNDVPSPLAHEAQRDVAEGAVLETEATGLLLDVGHAGRVAVSGSSVVEVGELEVAELVVRKGLVHVSQAVEGNSARPSLRIATPRGTIVLTSGGEALVAVTSSGKVFVGAWAGAIELRDGVVPVDGGVARPRLLVGGGTMLLDAGTDPVIATVEGSAGLEAQLRAEGRRVLGADRSTSRACTTESEAAASRLTSLSARLTSLETLRVQHADRARAHAPEAAELSRRIVAETQGVMRDRETVLVWLERAHACADTKDGSPVTPLLATARAALAPPGRRP